MKIQIRCEDLLNGIRKAKDICKKTINPILSNILIEALEDNIKIYSTNLNEYIMTTENAKVLKTGHVCINAEKIYQITSCLSGVLYLETIDNFLYIENGNSKFKMMTIADKDFPLLEVKNEGTILNLDAKEFKESIRKNLISTSKIPNDLLNSICFNIENNILELASTDGNRLSINKLNCIAYNTKFLIPKNTLINIIKYEINNIEIIVNDKSAIFIIDNTIYKTNIITDDYPPYNKLIPNNRNIVTINKNILLKSIEKISVMANEKTNIVKLIFDNNKLILLSESDNGSVEDIIDIDYNNEKLEICFNYLYILDFLKVVNNETVSIELDTSLSATIFKGEFLYLLMPVQMKG